MKTGESATPAATAVPSQALPVSSRPSSQNAAVAAIAAITSPGRWSPVAASDSASHAGHSGWYLNTTRSPATPVRYGRKSGT